MKRMEQTKMRVSGLEKVSFGLGDFAANGTFTFVSSYLLYFYTDSIKISLSTAGVILLLGRAVDAITCIIAGDFVDRTQTKYGRCRPFIAGAMVPMILLMCLLFFAPDLSTTAKVLLGGIGYVLFSISYAFVNVPFSTLLSVITNRNEERVSLNVFKNIGANAGALFVTMTALFFVDKLGDYMKTAILYAVIFFLCLFMCVCNTRERVRENKATKIGRKESAKIALKNKNWLIFITIQFTGMFYMIIHNQGTFYYTKYYLGDENLNTILLSLTPLMCILCAFILPALAKRIGMRNILICGHALVCLSLIGTWIVGENPGAVVACAVLTSLGWSMATGMIFVMLSQLIDWSQEQSGIRPQGFMTSWMTFFMKMGVAAAGFVGPWILKIGGYVAEQKAGEQTIQAIKANFVYIPMVLSLILMIACFAYRLPENKESEKISDIMEEM